MVAFILIGSIIVFCVIAWAIGSLLIYLSSLFYPKYKVVQTAEKKFRALKKEMIQVSYVFPRMQYIDVDKKQVLYKTPEEAINVIRELMPCDKEEVVWKSW